MASVCLVLQDLSVWKSTGCCIGIGSPRLDDATAVLRCAARMCSDPFCGNLELQCILDCHQVLWVPVQHFGNGEAEAIEAF